MKCRYSTYNVLSQNMYHFEMKYSCIVGEELLSLVTYNREEPAHFISFHSVSFKRFGLIQRIRRQLK
jgi:hypothetical protein